MHRTLRRLRTWLLAASTIAALAIAPAAAAAAEFAPVTVVGSGSASAGDVRTWSATVTNLPGPPDPWTQGGTLTVRTFDGTPISALAIDPTSTIDATVTSPTTVRIEPGALDGEELRITFAGRLRLSAFDAPTYVEVSAQSDDGAQEWAGIGGDSVVVQPVGGPSLVVAQVGPVVPSDGVADRWARLGATAASTLTVRNIGTGDARYVVVDVAATGTARREYSPEGPAPATRFAPSLILGGGTACAPVAAGSTTCEIALLPPGGVVQVPLAVGALDHYGAFSLAATVVSKGDRGNPLATSGWLGNDFFATRPSETIDVTDGSTVDAAVAMGGPSLGAGNTELAYTADIVNPGPDTANNGIVRLTASTFTTTGASADALGTFGEPAAPKVAGDPTLVQSLRRAELSNGTVCTNSVQRIQDAQGTWVDVRLVDTWDCPVGNLPAGTRITAKVAASFATSRVSDMRSLGGAQGIVATELLTTSYVRASQPFAFAPFGFVAFGSGPLGSRAQDAVVTGLNARDAIDLDVAVASPATIGAQRLATQRVTIRNAGATPATRVSLFGAVTSRDGSIEASRIATGCVLGGVDTPQAPPLRCFVGDLAPGASKTIEVPILAGTSRAPLVTEYSSIASEVDAVRANDRATFALDVVAPTAVPLAGVGVAPPKAVRMAAFLARGYATRTTVPANVTTRVDLKVSPAVAYALRLRTKRGIKADLVIGSTTTRTTKAGTVVVTVKVRRQYLAKLRAATGRVAIKRTTTVVSTERFTAGATSARTQTIRVTPVPRRRK